MVNVHIVLQELWQKKQHVWVVTAYHIESNDAITLPNLPPSPTRKFISPNAASKYVGRMVLSHLRQVRTDARGTDVLCHVRYA